MGRCGGPRQGSRERCSSESRNPRTCAHTPKAASESCWRCQNASTRHFVMQSGQLTPTLVEPKPDPDGPPPRPTDRVGPVSSGRTPCPHRQHSAHWVKLRFIRHDPRGRDVFRGDRCRDGEVSVKGRTHVHRLDVLGLRSVHFVLFCPSTSGLSTTSGRLHRGCRGFESLRAHRKWAVARRVAAFARRSGTTSWASQAACAAGVFSLRSRAPEVPLNAWSEAGSRNHLVVEPPAFGWAATGHSARSRGPLPDPSGVESSSLCAVYAGPFRAALLVTGKITLES